MRHSFLLAVLFLFVALTTGAAFSHELPALLGFQQLRTECSQSHRTYRPHRTAHNVAWKEAPSAPRVIACALLATPAQAYHHDASVGGAAAGTMQEEYDNEGRDNASGTEASLPSSAWDPFQELFEGHETPQRFMMRNVPYYFLRDELGIGQSKMLRISLEHGQVLSLSVSNNLRPKVQWLASLLSLDRAALAQVVSHSPNMLLLNVEDNLEPKLRWLCEELGLTPAERRQVVMRCPAFLASSTGSLLSKLELLREDLGLSREEVQKVVKAMPALLVLSVDNLTDKRTFLMSELGLAESDVVSLLLRSPALFFQSFENLRQKIRFLRKDLGFTDDAIRRMLMLVPRMMNYSLDRRMKPLVAALTKGVLGMKLTTAQVRSMVSKAPSLLGTDVTSKRFKATFDTLKETVGPSGLKALPDMVVRYPSVLSFTPERIRLSLGHVKELGGLTDDDIARVLHRHPQLLGYRPEAVEEKLRVVASVYGVDMTEVRPALVKYPTLLSYGVASRLEPRLRAAREAGATLEKAVSWLSLPEARFNQRLQDQLNPELKAKVSRRKKQLKPLPEQLAKVRFQDRELYRTEKEALLEDLWSM